MGVTREYKSLSLLFEFNSSACKLQLKKKGSLFSSKWLSERLSNKSFPDMPLLGEGLDSTLRVRIPKFYEEEVRKARRTARKHKTPNARRGCDWYFVESLGGFRKNQSNAKCTSKQHKTENEEKRAGK